MFHDREQGASQNVSSPIETDVNTATAFVFARGGSKGLPRKNIRDFAGKPLIAHAIETARASDRIRRIVVSTDDEEIAQIARFWGGEVPFMRPAELAADDSPELLSWKHAVSALERAGDAISTFVSVPATSPLRNVEDINRCIELLEASDADLVLTVTPARHHPMYSMVTFGDNGVLRTFSEPESAAYRRQDMSPVFDISGSVYAARRDFVMAVDPRKLLSGRTRGVPVPPERSIDIDTELDFALAEFVFRRRHGGA